MLHRLPYDVVRVLLPSIDGSDVAHLFVTCKALYKHMEDEDIWRELCARYKVEDRAVFDNASFREIYALVLHTYGPSWACGPAITHIGDLLSSSAMTRAPRASWAKSGGCGSDLAHTTPPTPGTNLGSRNTLPSSPSHFLRRRFPGGQSYNGTSTVPWTS